MTDEIDEISNAIELATRAHYNQFDKQGEPYIFHPLRVMMKFSDKEERIIAVLHDTIEDSELELSDLDDCGFSDYVINIVDILTRKKDYETYEQYLENVRQNPVALRIKLADIADNESRLNDLWKIDRNEYRRLEKKYRNARKILSKR